MRQQKIIATVREYKHKSTSYNGNPQFRVSMERLDGTTFEAITARDALAAYYVRGSRNTTFVVTYHVTAKGTQVIDFLTPLEPRRYAYESGKGVKYADDYNTAYVGNVLAHGPISKIFTLDTHTGEVIRQLSPPSGRRKIGFKS